MFNLLVLSKWQRKKCVQTQTRGDVRMISILNGAREAGDLLQGQHILGINC